MSVIVIKRRKREHIVPAGGEILWYGIAAKVPLGWSIIDATKDVFIRGCDIGDQTDAVDGSFSHDHTNPAKTGIIGNHTHKVSLSATAAIGSETFQHSTNANSSPAGHIHSGGSKVDSSSAGGHDHTLSDTKSATIYPPYHRLYWITPVDDEPLPIGGIIMWDDTLANLGDRFKGTVKVCDGNNGTLDLREKFIYGAGVDGDIGAGGDKTHVHGNNDTGSDGKHTHSATVTTAAGASVKNIYNFDTGGVAKGGHTHTTTKNLNEEPAHIHTLKDTNPATNLPPYVKLYFVQRTK